jgi:putative hydroxymethylpyrimidine transport system ATP-binding protein
MQELAGELLAGKTVALITHDPGDAARLSHRAFLMNERGLSELALPQSAPVRSYDDKEVIAAQAQMLRLLRSGS